jgi:hypothetical protein
VPPVSAPQPATQTGTPPVVDKQSRKSKIPSSKTAPIAQPITYVKPKKGKGMFNFAVIIIMLLFINTIIFCNNVKIDMSSIDVDALAATPTKPTKRGKGIVNLLSILMTYYH